MPRLPYSPDAPTRAHIDAQAEPVVLDFGTDWCGFCRASAPFIEQALADRPSITHIKVEDGKGRRLGRELGVKLWPTVIVLKHGQEVGRVVRPNSVADVASVLHALDTTP